MYVVQARWKVYQILLCNYALRKTKTRLGHKDLHAWTEVMAIPKSIVIVHIIIITEE